ncbi:MAG: arylesterase [Rhizobiaceae bacterium]
MAFKRFVAAILVGIATFFPAASSWAKTFRIVGFGDSLMAGYQLGPGQSFTDQLQAALRKDGFDATVANAGVSGDTTSDGLARLAWSVPDGTDMVLLELGANDMLRGIKPTITKKNLDEMIRKLQARKIGIVLMGMLAAPNLGSVYTSAFNAIYPDLARQYGLPFYPFFLNGVAGDPDLQLSDGMHPTAKGVAVMVKGALPVIEKAIRIREKQS